MPSAASCARLRCVAFARPHLRVHRRRHQDLRVASPAARRWRDRRRGRSPSSPSGPRSPARRRSDRLRAPGGCGRCRTRASWSNRSVNTRSPTSAPADSGVTNCCAALVRMHAHVDVALLQPADQVERFVGGDAAADDEQDARRCRPGWHVAPALRDCGRHRCSGGSARPPPRAVAYAPRPPSSGRSWRRAAGAASSVASSSWRMVS